MHVVHHRCLESRPARRRHHTGRLSRRELCTGQSLSRGRIGTPNDVLCHLSFSDFNCSRGEWVITISKPHKTKPIYQRRLRRGDAEDIADGHAEAAAETDVEELRVYEQSRWRTHHFQARKSDFLLLDGGRGGRQAERATHPSISSYPLNLSERYLLGHQARRKQAINGRLTRLIGRWH